MKRSFRFLLLSTSIATISIPILAISCNTKEDNKKKVSETKITKSEKSIIEDGNWNPIVKKETKKLNNEVNSISSNKERHFDEIETPLEDNNELDEIASNLKDIFEFNDTDEAHSALTELFKDKNKYNLWYSWKDRNIVISKKGEIPFGKHRNKVVIFTLKNNEETNKVISPIQLINAKNPTFKGKNKDWLSLSNRLDFEIKDNRNNKLELIIKYKVGKYIQGADPEVSKEENQSIVSFEISQTEEILPYEDDSKFRTPDSYTTIESLDSSSFYDDYELLPSDSPSEFAEPVDDPSSFESESSSDISLANGEFKLGHWNILKFTGDDKKQKDKTKRIALLSEKEKFDILGLTEVNKPEGVQKIVDEMNKLSHSNMYAYIVSNKEKGSTFNNNSAESVAIIYNTKKFEPIAFNNGQQGYSYKEKFTDFLGNNNAEYARPPYGVQFKYKLNPDKKMTFVFDHFDGPGSKKGEGKKDGMGIFEYREAKHLEEVLKHFEKISDDNASIFFGGDTNIPIGKEKLAFDWLKKYNGSSDYETVFDDSDANKSSLDGKGIGYSHPYDKIFYKSNFKLIKKEVFDLYKVVNDSAFRKLFEDNNVVINGIDLIRKGSYLSDHTYISATFKIA
ncbi:Hypothetical protein, predicted membrane nuclease, predicted lipoprotein [Metamycoplasma auris 15026]|uniref:Membrane nuclease A n=1 Tax=Metamycoplasma auris 15026 TaxID=1188233 RepID=N9V1G5_9BACT|nr:membrane nuclease [Metamycoplasma auris]ENY69202.1 Hypothetical protein, predicted membrane nuclease, predicted lipoprotein [Metamycoplasma auris 15026]